MAKPLKGSSGSIELSGQHRAPTPEHEDLHAEDFRSKKSTKYEHQPLIEEKDDFDEQEGKIGLLLSAASRNHLQKMLSLLRSGVRPDSADYDKRTALHLAASEGHLAAIKLLIDEGADVNVKDRFGHTPLDDAAKGGFDDIVAHLQNSGARFGAISELEGELIMAASIGNMPDVKRLLATGKGADGTTGSAISPNCCDYDKRYPLHLAVANGHIEVVKELLIAKADPNVIDRWGLSPLEDALRRATRVGTDPMKELFMPFVKDSQGHGWSKFIYFFVFWEIVMIILFGIFCRYEETADGTHDPAVSIPVSELTGSTNSTASDHELQVYYHSLDMYPLFQDVHVMIFIGFGYLMTFLRKNGYGAVGLTFLIGGFTIQWYILCRGFWHGAFDSFEKIYIDVYDYLCTGDFAAGAVLITYGVLLGKVSPFQILFIGLVETVFFSLNERISLELGIADIGGTMVIHMFGAFFGMAVSLVIGQKSETLNKPDNAAVYHSDLFAMIGTVFLWMYWPSFNAAPGVGPAQHRAIINTLLSLCGSVVAAFLTSQALRHQQKFCMVDVQNATLAGGVAMGTCASMVIYPASAIGIGCSAGIISVLGYVYVQPFLEDKLGLHDTCGVNNLHGIPSLIGAFAGIIAAGAVESATYSAAQLELVFPKMEPAGDRDAARQALFQFIFICITLGISIFTGLLTGFFAKQAFFEPLEPRDTFLDQVYWEVPELEMPYFFDKRGEISREPSAMQQVPSKDGRRPSYVPLLGHKGGSAPMAAAQNKELEQRIFLLEAAIKRGITTSPSQQQQLGTTTSMVTDSGSGRRIESLLEVLLRKVEGLESRTPYTISSSSSSSSSSLSSSSLSSSSSTLFTPGPKSPSQFAVVRH